MMMKALLLYILFFQSLEIFCHYHSLTDFIAEKYLKYTEEEVMLSKCILRLIQHYTSHRRQLILILREVDFDVSVISQNSTVKLHFDGNVDAEFQKMIGTIVVKSEADMKTILKNSRWTANTRFVVFIPRIVSTDRFYLDDLKYQNLHFNGVISEKDIRQDLRKDFLPHRDAKLQDRLERQIKNILGQFKDLRVMNAVVAVPQKSKIYFYTYIPYSRFNCADRTVVVLLNVWYSEGEKFYKDIKLFPNKTANLFRCPLNVSLVSSPPGVIKSGDGTVRGIEGGMISEILEMMNATPVYRFVDFEETNLNESVAAMNYALNEIKNGISDLGAGLLIPTIPLAAETDDVNICLTVCLTWAVPNQAKEKGYVAPIFETFTLRLWFLVLTVVAFSILIFWMFHQKDFGDSALKIFAVFLNKNAKMPRENPSRIFITSFAWYSVIVYVAFQAGLGSKNIVGYLNDQLETTEDVIKSGLGLTGVDAATHLFFKDIEFFRENGKKIFVQPMDIHSALVKVAFERKTAYVGLRLAMRYFSRVVDTDIRDRVFIQKECLVQYHTFLALRKNSPFTDRFNQLISRLIENGFKERLNQNYAARMLKGEKKKKKKKTEHMYGALGALIILMFGLGVSFILFLCEHVVHYLYRRNQI